MNHLPKDNIFQLKKKRFRCELHRWDHRACERRDLVIVCTTCNVSLCIPCYHVFHVCTSICELRRRVIAIMEEDIRHK